ncbi:MAG: Unknown protein [uncultured Aureispira sp.]|uniref:Outer membrane protein beta-barrel domain-containing protein n=1 Tax=uncultured Aureispira sp. TaxID=1331704 RepID=A0A6S6U3C1_9BACT|nr:MAG: Unknown protein [uncultured Aureispira sp.]
MYILKKTILLLVCAFLPSCLIAQSVFDFIGENMIGYRVNYRNGKSVGVKASFIMPTGNWSYYYGPGVGVDVLWGVSDIEDDIHHAWSVGVSRLGTLPKEFLQTTSGYANGQPILIQSREAREHHLSFSVGNIFDVRLLDRPISPVIGIDIHAHYHMFNINKENAGWEWFSNFGATITPRLGMNFQAQGTAKFRLNAGYTFAFFPNSRLGGGHHLKISLSAYICYDR